MTLTKPMMLEIKKDNHGYGLYLDGKEIRAIKKYKIVSSANGETAELTIKMLVSQPTIEEKTDDLDNVNKSNKAQNIVINNYSDKN